LLVAYIRLGPKRVMNNDECGAQTHHPSYEVERDAKDETEPHLVELQYATSNISIERDERDDVVNTRLSILWTEPDISC
jgi:hypothetical protein